MPHQPNLDLIEMSKVEKHPERVLVCSLHPGVSIVFSTREHDECPLCKIEGILEKMNLQLDKAVGK
jgi:hypothetical protein